MKIVSRQDGVKVKGHILFVALAWTKKLEVPLRNSGNLWQQKASIPLMAQKEVAPRRDLMIDDHTNWANSSIIAINRTQLSRSQLNSEFMENGAKGIELLLIAEGVHLIHCSDLVFGSMLNETGWKWFDSRFQIASLNRAEVLKGGYWTWIHFHGIPWHGRPSESMVVIDEPLGKFIWATLGNEENFHSSATALVRSSRPIVNSTADFLLGDGIFPITVSLSDRPLMSETTFSGNGSSTQSIPEDLSPSKVETPDFSQPIISNSNSCEEGEIVAQDNELVPIASDPPAINLDIQAVENPLVTIRDQRVSHVKSFYQTRSRTRSKKDRAATVGSNSVNQVKVLAKLANQEVKWRTIDYTALRSCGLSGGLMCELLPTDGSKGCILTLWRLTCFLMETIDIIDRALVWSGRYVASDSAVAFVNIYAPNSVVGRKTLWDNLLLLIPSLPEHSVLGGDFNAVMNLSERRNCSSSRSDIRAFQDFVSRLGHIDLPMSGSLHTWYSHDSKSSRLDRFFVSADFLNTFGHVKQSSFPRDISDHRPIMIFEDLVNWVLRPIKFPNAWTKHISFLPTVLALWNSCPSFESASFTLWSKLKSMRRDLQVWNNEVFGIVDQDIEKLSKNIDDLDKIQETRDLSGVEKTDRAFYGALLIIRRKQLAKI